MDKKELEEIQRYKDYPEGSVGKEVYDSVFLPSQEYLQKYYSSPDLSAWEIWQKKYVEPAYEESRHDEMVKNFGYVKKEFHDFNAQYEIINHLANDNRLDDETRKFVGFMAGVGFFRRYEITVEQWFAMLNWSHPEHERDEGRTINGILQYTYGINLLKADLPQIPFWRR